MVRTSSHGPTLCVPARAQIDAMTQRFFRKAHSQPKRLKLPKPKPAYTGNTLLQVKLGSGAYRLMTARQYNHLRGVSKGGSRTTGWRPGRFTSETSQKANKKLWGRYWRQSKRTGNRLGMPRRRRPQAARAPLRAYYAEHPTNGIQFHTLDNSWTLTTQDAHTGELRTMEISERTALTRLRHLPSKQDMPVEIMKVIPFTQYGIKTASREYL